VPFLPFFFTLVAFLFPFLDIFSPIFFAFPILRL
jgi:hypothetical protein